ncbi:MAG: PP2C family protein-serine/threonine phosphatase, partial [Planctomycetota bacterium]
MSSLRTRPSADDSTTSPDLRHRDVLGAEPETALDRITLELSRIFDVPGAFISFADADAQWYISGVGSMPGSSEGIRAGTTGCSPCGHVVATNSEIFIEDVQADARFCADPDLAAAGVRFYAGIPLRDAEKAIGAMCIVDVRPRRMSAREHHLLRLIAEGAMATARLQSASRDLLHRRLQIERDLEQAVEVQRALLPPSVVEGKTWRVEHVYRPVAHLGGDFVDVMQRRDGRWAAILGDVTGHGTSAALTTAMVKTAFRRSAGRVDTPGELLDLMNRDLGEAIAPGRFVTAIAALLSPVSGAVALASAGHPHPVAIGADGGAGRVVEIETGLPLCVSPDPDYPVEAGVILERGERLLFYTDGAVENEDAHGRMLSSPALADIAARAA